MHKFEVIIGVLNALTMINNWLESRDSEKLVQARDELSRVIDSLTEEITITPVEHSTRIQ